MFKRYSTFATGLIFIAILGGIFTPLLTRADEADDLREKIAETQDQVEKINKEIAEFERQLQMVGAEKSTLQAAINELNLTRKKLLTDITLTQKKIEQTTYTIREIELDIDDSESKIERNDRILASALRDVHAADGESLIETILSNESISDLWIELDQMEQLQNTIYAQLADLRAIKTDLEEQHTEQRSERENLTVFKDNLAGQQRVIDENAKNKSDLLAVTKNKEAEYQALLAEKQAARTQIESAMQEYESKLTYILDPSRLPQKGSGGLVWPIANPILTQGYGITSFAAGGAYGYDAQGNPNPHRGIDFKASVGTPLLAAASGTVRDAVDMDKTPGCYSYGKWILIDHDNGLSTLYAHLSVFNVSAGDSVTAGQIIGYSGQSGYATGPHLHFSAFDREAVKVSPFSWSNGCKNAKVPYAPYEAYLNPLSYLPD